jgi:hypothetical protein
VLGRVRDDLGFGLVLTEDALEELDLLLVRGEDETGKGGEAVEAGDDFEGVALGSVGRRRGNESGREGREDGEGRTDLVDQEFLALGRVEHLGRVLRDERVEEGIEPLIISPLGSEDSTWKRGTATRVSGTKNIDRKKSDATDRDAELPDDEIQSDSKSGSSRSPQEDRWRCLRPEQEVGGRELAIVDESRIEESVEGTNLGQEDRADERIVLEAIQDSHSLDLGCRSVDKGLPELDGVGLLRRR